MQLPQRFTVDQRQLAHALCIVFEVAQHIELLAGMGACFSQLLLQLRKTNFHVHSRLCIRCLQPLIRKISLQLRPFAKRRLQRRNAMRELGLQRLQRLAGADLVVEQGQDELHQIGRVAFVIHAQHQ